MIVYGYFCISIYHALISKITHSRKLSAFFHALKRNPRLNTVSGIQFQMSISTLNLQRQKESVKAWSYWKLFHVFPLTNLSSNVCLMGNSKSYINARCFWFPIMNTSEDMFVIK